MSSSSHPRYLSDQQTEKLVRAFDELPEFKPGDFVFKQGDMGDKFYIIKSGEVRAQINNGRYFLGRVNILSLQSVMFMLNNQEPVSRPCRGHGTFTQIFCPRGTR